MKVDVNRLAALAAGVALAITGALLRRDDLITVGLGLAGWAAPWPSDARRAIALERHEDTLRALACELSDEERRRLSRRARESLDAIAEDRRREEQRHRGME